MTTEPMTRDELKELLLEVLREHFELVGMDATSASSRVEIRKDMEMLRSLRLRVDRAAAQIGHAVLWLMIAGALVLLGLGAKVKLLS